MQTSASINRVFYEMCEDAYNDGVVVLEVRFSPILHIENGLSLAGVMEAVCEGLARAEIDFSIKARILVCGMRHMSPSVSLDLAEIAWRYKHKGVAGFDLAGPELGYSSKMHKEAFSLIRQKGVNCTLHSGEDSTWHSVADSIHHCGANRIGHGIAVQQNDDLLEYMVNRRIPIECCLTSNHQIKALKEVADHPIRKYFDRGAIVALCCDNVTMSNILLSGEYKLAIDTFGFSVEEVVRLIDHSFSATFLEEPLKSVIRKLNVRKAVAIFQEEGYDISGVIANKDYYLENGIDVTISKPVYSPIPEVTFDMIKQLPKADLHCRFDGSVSLELVWKELNSSSSSDIDLEDIGCSTYEQFAKVIQNPNHTSHSIQVAKKIMNSVLQTSDQINRGFDDIITTAKLDNIRCDITIGIIVHVTADVDDAIDFLSTANMAVEYRDKGVIGFGIFGTDHIPAEEMKNFQRTFDYLKSENFNVVQFSGNSEIHSMVASVHVGGANRLSGAFQVHKYPRIMSYLSNYSIPVEVSLTPMLKNSTKDLSFTTPIRHLLDSRVPLAICSFRSTLYDVGRNQMLMDIVQDSQLNLKQLIVLLRAPFSYNFQPHTIKNRLKTTFNTITTSYLSSLNIDITKLQ
eukprot:gene3705-4267_t